MAGSESDIRITTGTPHLALTGELWGVYCEDFGENRLCYNGTALYLVPWENATLCLEVNACFLELNNYLLDAVAYGL